MYFLKINKQRILMVAFISSVIAVLFGLLSGAVPFEHFVSALETSIYFSNDPLTVWAMVLFCIPYILFLTPLTGFFKQDFNIQTIYCFTRRKNYLEWYLKKSASLAAQALFSQLLFFGLCIVTVFCIADFPRESIAASAAFTLQAFALAWLFVFAFAFLMNALSFFASSKWILPAGVTFFTANAFLLPFSIEHESFLRYLNPIVHINMTMHEGAHPLFAQYSQMAPGLKFWHSVLFFLAIIAVSFAAGYLKISRSDLGLMLDD